MSKEVYVDFREHAPVMSIAAGSAATGADTTVSNVAAGRHNLELYYAAANSDIGFTRNAAGWVLPNDNTDNEGGELGLGILASGAEPGHFTIGTDAAFSAKLVCKIPDVSDYDIFAFGFRKAAAYVAVASLDTPAELLTAWTDVGGLNVNAGDIYTITRLNSGTGTATDSTDNLADGTEVTLEVKVSAAGVVTFEIDGSAPTVNTNTLTFDTGDIVVPFLRYTKGGTAADTPPIIKSLTVKYQ